MTTKTQFLRRAEQIGLDLSLRNTIAGNPALFDQLGDYFQIHHCETVLGKHLLASQRPPEVVYYQQAVPDMVQYQTQPTRRKSKKSNSNTTLLTVALSTVLVLLLVAVGYVFMSGASPEDFAAGFGANNSGSSEAVPTSCGGNVPNTYLTFGVWTSDTDQNQYFVPKNSPSLQEGTTALCFNYEEMSRFYSQATIVTNTGTYSGQEALARSIINATVKSEVLGKDDPRAQTLYQALLEALNPDKFLTFQDPSFAKFRYLQLPALSELSAQSAPTQSSSSSNSAPSQPIIPAASAVPVTPTSAMIMEIMPTSTLGPIPGPTIAFLVENYGTYPTPTLGPLPASEVNRLIELAQTQQAQQATPTPGSLSGSTVNSLILTAQATAQP